MKRFFFVVAALGFVLGYGACERQEWEETRTLHMKDESHGGGDTAESQGDKKH